MIDIHLTPTQADKFWAQVDKAGTNECWPWTGATSYGYGVFSPDSRHTRAHRIAWTLTHGPIPHGLLVCHSCDRPACVNPSHLFVGTLKDNAIDAVRKGRTTPPRIRGAEHYNSRKTHCSKGHEFTTENTYVWDGRMRNCRICHSARTAAAFKASRKGGSE